MTAPLSQLDGQIVLFREQKIDCILISHARRGVGYWRSEHEPNLPDPQDFVGTFAERDEFLAVLRTVAVFRSWGGPSECRFCGALNGTQDCSLDGTWVWPIGYAHYVEVHGVVPPQEFVSHVLLGVQSKEIR